jgi:vacuolar protein sorting-associated protein 45
MDVMQAVSGYISKMMTVGDGAAGTASAKMKILLLDSETVRVACCAIGTLGVTNIQVQIISAATTQSALLGHDVYLTEYALSSSNFPCLSLMYG